MRQFGSGSDQRVEISGPRPSWQQESCDGQDLGECAGVENERSRDALRCVADTNGWSVRDLYRTLETPGANRLRDAHAPSTPPSAAPTACPTSEDPLAFLLRLNLELAATEATGEPITAPGLPSLDAADRARQFYFSRLHPTVAWLRLMDPPQTPTGTPPDYISIPEHLKSKPIGPPQARLAGGPRLGARLCYLFEGAGIQVLGDLDGKRLSDFEQHRNCGAGTIWALRRLILRALYPGRKLDLSTRPIPMRYWLPLEHTLEVPDDALALKIRDLPVSAHLEGVLKEWGIERFGQLKGVPFGNVQVRRSCGKTTQAELQALLARAETGEFTFTQRELAAKTPADLVRMIDDLISRLPERRRTILTFYFGATAEGPLTYREIGLQCGITGSRVGQQLSGALEWIRREGSVRLLALLNLVEGVCSGVPMPLKTKMVSAWQDTARPFRYRPEFYVRLIHRLLCEADARSGR